MILGVLHLGEIAIVVIGELRQPLERIGELFDPIHHIVLDEGAIPERIRDLGDPGPAHRSNRSSCDSNDLSPSAAGLVHR